MKKTITKAFAMLLVLMLVATQIIVPVVAAEPLAACTCGTEGHESDVRVDGGFHREYAKPTCKDVGAEYHKCLTCGGEFMVGLPVSSTHAWGDLVATVDATCTAEGTKAYKVCKDCAVKGIDDGTGTFVAIAEPSELVIPMVAHSYDDVVTAPTCTVDGYTTHTCSVCSHSYTDAETTAPGHNLVDVAEKPADCKESGYSAHKACTECDYTEGKTDYPKLTDHTFNEEITAATCHATGTNKYTCTTEGCPRKDEAVIEIIPMLEHVKGEVIKENYVAGDCNTNEEWDDVVYCTLCGDELDRDHKSIIAGGHRFVEVVAVAAKCEADGNEGYKYCERCFKVAGDDTPYVDLDAVKAAHIIPATGHLNQAPFEYLAPTCTKVGYKDGIQCTDCGEVLRDRVEVPALGHTEAAPVIENDVAATCTTERTYDSVVYCSVCNEELSRTAMTEAALGHDYVDHSAQTATCTQEGWDAYQTCSRCDYSSKVIIPMIPHNYVQLGVIKATCETDGKFIYECDACKGAYNEKIPARNHETVAAAVKENEVAATCTTDGSYDSVVYCACEENEKYAACNAEVSRENIVVPATNHKDTLIQHDAKAATCTAIGWNGYETCSVCDYTTYAEIAALGHDYSIVVDAQIADYDHAGHDAGKKCSRCDSVEGSDTVPVLNESVKFTLKLNGINGVANAVNSGYVYANIYMEVLPDAADKNNIEAIARISAAKMQLDFDEENFIFVGLESYMLDTAVVNKNANEVGYVNIVESMAPTVVKTCTGTTLFATLKFKVKGDALTANHNFGIAKDSIEYNRVGTYINETSCVNDADITTAIAVVLIGSTDDKVAYTTTDLTNMSTYFANPEATYADGYVYDMNKDGEVDFVDYELLMGAVAGNNDYLA